MSRHNFGLKEVLEGDPVAGCRFLIPRSGARCGAIIHGNKAYCEAHENLQPSWESATGMNRPSQPAARRTGP